MGKGGRKIIRCVKSGTHIHARTLVSEDHLLKEYSTHILV